MVASDSNEPPPVMTTKARVVQDYYDFKYYIEHRWSNGEWRRNHSWPTFSTIADAQAYFERAKKVRKANPAELGDLNDG